MEREGWSSEGKVNERDLTNTGKGCIVICRPFFIVYKDRSNGIL